MTDIQFRVKVLNVIIGTIGDISSTNNECIKMAALLRDALVKIDKFDDKEGLKVAMKNVSPHMNIESTYNKFVDSACALINKDRTELEKEAFEDKF